MRRLSLSWILSLLLVFAQHGAVLHELGHLSHGSHASGTSLSDLTSQDSYCSTCEAFAQVANPAPGGAAALTLGLPPVGAIAACGHALRSADIPTARSRGPPQV
jgi:hypothetical protein